MTRPTLLRLACALTAAAFCLGAAGPVLAMGGDSPDSDQVKWKMWIDEGRIDDALAELEAKAQMVPNDPDVLTLYGYGLRKKGDFDRAEAVYRQALDLDDDHLGAMNYLGHLYVETGRPGEADALLARLDDACFFGCKEYTELKAMIETGKSGKY